jgi:capsular polysaccharide export protein
LKDSGASVWKVNFNGGDCLFYPCADLNFTGHLLQWQQHCEQIVVEHKIDLILLFGDCRPIHQVAHEVAERLNIEVGVYEEGYLRPDYITFERYGVNGRSKIPRDSLFYEQLKTSGDVESHILGNTYWFMAIRAILYYLAAAVLFPFFWRYQHHRPLTILEGVPWLKSIWRKQKYRYLERHVQKKLTSYMNHRFFLVPLQVHNDAQIHAHSGYDSVSEFIREAMASFANFSPEECILVFKHHPLDRGYHDYSTFIEILAASHGIKNRVMYVHDQHLPTLLNAARGVVVVNSTVGLSAVDHCLPVKVCGDALYDIKGITYQGSLDSFWTADHADTVNTRIFKNFKNYLIEHTQINASFYKFSYQKSDNFETMSAL